MANLGDVFREVERLVASRAVHRSGFVVADVEPEFVFSNLLKECQELHMELDIGTRETTRLEVADVLGVVLHLALKLGMSEGDLSDAVLAKFKERFYDD